MVVDLSIQGVGTLQFVQLQYSRGLGLERGEQRQDKKEKTDSKRSAQSAVPSSDSSSPIPLPVVHVANYRGKQGERTSGGYLSAAK